MAEESKYITKKKPEYITIKKPKYITKKKKAYITKKDQGDILGDRFDKKFKKYASSKEAQLHAKDFDEGVDRGESRAAKEVAQEIGMPMRSGGRVCKLATKGKGKAYGKNS